VHNNIRNPRDFPKAVYIAFGINVVVHLIFGFFVVACFGDSISGVIIKSITGGDWVFIVKLALCLDMLFSYAIVFIPARELFEHALLKLSVNSGLSSIAEPSSPDNDSPIVMFSSTHPSSSPYLSRKLRSIARRLDCALLPTTIQTKQNLIRGSLYGVTVIACLGIPMFSVVISLVGGVAMTSLAFVFPPLMALHIASVYNTTHSDLSRSDPESGSLLPKPAIFFSTNHNSNNNNSSACPVPNSPLAFLYYRIVILFGLLIILLTIFTSFLQIVETFQSETRIESC
jgi:amino acid permease